MTSAKKVNLFVEYIAQQDTILLRHEVLRKNQPIESCYYTEDGLEGCFHLGIKENDRVVCIASFYPENHPSINGANQFRFRGMATSTAFQGKGLGSSLILGAIELLKDAKKSGFVLWCNARSSACGFYKKLGFEIIGDEFEIDGIGPHFVMFRKIEAK